MTNQPTRLHHDNDVEPENNPSRRGYNPGANMMSPPPSSDGQPRDSHVSQSAYKNDLPSTPPSRPTSNRSGSHTTPTTYVTSKKEHVRYSWQSIHDDEPNKPRIHVIKIVSNTATASAGLGDQGEALAFSLSPAGKRIAAYNSARLFVFQTAALPVNVSHEYALRRKPLAVEICDEANILAVMTDEHTINIYEWSLNEVRRTRTIRTDLPVTAIALSSTGGLLATAYEGGIEVFSLLLNALLSDRRAVRTPKMDKLAFSQDDSTLLGTTTRIFASSTVVVSVPMFPTANSGTPTHQELKESWCTGMLDPQNIKNSSHATFMRIDGAMTNDKLFAWNGLEDTFGLLHAQDMLYSQVDFPVSISPPLSTCGGLGAAIHHTPSVDELGSAIAMIVNDRTVRLYIVPQEVGDGTSKIEAHSIDHELDEEYGCPFSDLRWVHSSSSLPATSPEPSQIRGRLVVASPGGRRESDKMEHMVQDVEGGRLILFDFDPQFAGQPGQTFVLNLGKAPPLTLEEELMDVADEVALVRRRTITSQRSNTLGKKAPSLGRAATTVSRRQQEDGSSPYRNGSPQQPLIHTSPWRNRRLNPSISSDASRSLPDLLESTEAGGEPFEQPYVQGAPRSVATMHRAATAANAHRFQAYEEREAEAERPGELPLPTYTEQANQPLPGRFRALAGLNIPDTGRQLQEDRSPVSAITTAPPIMQGYQFPASATSALSQPPPNLPRGIHPAYSHSTISPITSVSQSSPALTDWTSPSPALTRNQNRLTLRTEPSWETINTNMQTMSQPPSTLRSRPSWESNNGIPSFFSPVTQGSQTAPTSPEHMHPPQTLHGLGIGLSDFRHSLLLPQESPERIFNSPPEQLRNSHQHRPAHVNAIHAVHHVKANNLLPSEDPSDRRSASSTGAISAMSTSSNSHEIPVQNRGGAGTAAYPVTAWFPPAPPSPDDSQQSSRSRSTGPMFPSPEARRRASVSRSLYITTPTSNNANISYRTPRSAGRPATTTPTAIRGSTGGYSVSSAMSESSSSGTGTGTSRSTSMNEAKRRAWVKQQREKERLQGIQKTLPIVGHGVREEFLRDEAMGKKCVFM